MPSSNSQTHPSVNTRGVAANEIASPCVSVCIIDPALGMCVGCHRTLDEIAAWIDLDTTQRLAVWDAIAERKKVADAHR